MRPYSFPNNNSDFVFSLLFPTGRSNARVAFFRNGVRGGGESERIELGAAQGRGPRRSRRRRGAARGSRGRGRAGPWPWPCRAVAVPCRSARRPVGAGRWQCWRVDSALRPSAPERSRVKMAFRVGKVGGWMDG